MLVTQTLAELCALLVDDIYGELPSRIFATLLNKGRSSIPQLVQHTSLTPRQLRHGLAVLIQHNLLYYQVDDSGITTYDACAENAYNLIRTGKILEMVETLYGSAEKDVLQSLLLLGHTQISDLKSAYETKINAHNAAVKAEDEQTVQTNGEEPHHTGGDLAITSLEHLNSTLCRLAEAELIVVVNPTSFRSPEDTFKDVETEVLTEFFPGGVKGGKGKDEFNQKLASRLREVRDEPKRLKRKLEQGGQIPIKRRKMTNGDVANGMNNFHADPPLDPKIVLRINYEKCVVDLRSQQLMKAASDFLGEPTAQVYGVLLRLLGRKLSRCQLDPRMDSAVYGGMFGDDLVVNTMELLDNLPTSVDVGMGIGRVKPIRIDRKSAEATQPHPSEKIPFFDEAEVDGDASSDEEEEDENESDAFEEDFDYENDQPNGHGSPEVKMNGTKKPRVKFEDGAVPKESRVSQMRQHLLLLSGSKQGFVRHCGHDRWTVDFDLLVRRLRESELDTVIERTVRREGLRLVRILRQKGKMDEKTLPTIALMTKPEVQKKMLQMQLYGYVDMQEVPRDTNRTANRTMFLYWCDTNRSLDRLLDNTYKTMVRCLQRLEVHRQKEREVLEIVKRSDVKGREQQVMEKRYYDKFVKVTEIQEKLLGHVMRLDDLVGILRDY